MKNGKRQKRKFMAQKITIVNNTECSCASTFHEECDLKVKTHTKTCEHYQSTNFKQYLYILNSNQIWVLQ